MKACRPDGGYGLDLDGELQALLDIVGGPDIAVSAAAMVALHLRIKGAAAVRHLLVSWRCTCFACKLTTCWMSATGETSRSV